MDPSQMQAYAQQAAQAQQVAELQAVQSADLAKKATAESKAAEAVGKLLQVSSSGPAQPAWLPPGKACSLCAKPAAKDYSGVVCRRRRDDSSLAGCGSGVCWACMESASRLSFGMVRTTKEEFEMLETEAWWMHEVCMTKGDLSDYFGGEKEYKEAKAAAAKALDLERQQRSAADAMKSASKARQAQLETEKASVLTKSVRELKEWIESRGSQTADCIEKAELRARALELLAKEQKGGGGSAVSSGPAWMPAKSDCSLCVKTVKKQCGGVLCRRNRADGTTAGCGKGVCWRCMKRAPRDEFGTVRCTQGEFESLGHDAWWMHEKCMLPTDLSDYHGDSPEGAGAADPKADD